MKEFNEFMDSLILAEKVSPDDDMVVLNSMVNFGDYEIRVNFYDTNLDNMCSYSIETLMKDKMITFIFSIEDFDTNSHILLLKKFLNKKFKGTLFTEIISIKPDSILTIRGSLISLKSFLACHKQIIIEFFQEVSS